MQDSAASLIDIFIESRWSDAKEALRKLDPKYVEQHENTVRLQRIGLAMPWIVDPTNQPQLRLSKKWYRLLEGCYELARQVMVLKTSGECLRDESMRNEPLQVAGARATYNLKSWFIHAVALCEQVELVISRTLDVYISESAPKKEIRKNCKSLIRHSVREHVFEQRRNYLHPDSGSWAQGITKDKLWEGAVSIGLTPRREFEKFSLCKIGSGAQNGKYNIFDVYTEETLIRLAQILNDFERDMAKHREVR